MPQGRAKQEGSSDSGEILMQLGSVTWPNYS
ncbi:hypothetical protein FOVG_03458 [Fusarium oxysporum f. sp. pisi HDV247]|uniref:Uncharacterized protein n=1 Tax=Fusarium oxysporum f. sp. pisi HDV247 TaxID=1080344 RepID=W9Q6U7_FUSOX|nr:hypothetical protein FOVG_03458 [Fusarium oxysporum f. sp. pisi HDV247]